MLQQENVHNSLPTASHSTVLLLLLFIVLASGRLLHAQCPPVECMGFWEMEPNDIPEMASPMPMMEPICGELSPPFDTDFFMLEPGLECFDFFLQCDDHDPYIQIWGESEMGFEILASFDTPEICAPEMGQWQWNPCDVPEDFCPPWFIEVGVHEMDPPMPALYQLDIIPIPLEIIPGDCAMVSLPLPDLSFSIDLATHFDYHDNGFEPSPDIWHDFYLSESGTFEAWTCDGTTDFPTHILILDGNGTTVLAESFESGMCWDAPDRSWISVGLEDGPYFLVVEGRDFASGNVTLSGEFTPAFQNTDLVIGEWGNDAEFWHQRFTNDNLNLQFFVDDPCDEIYRVDFYQSLDGEIWDFLGSDEDGSKHFPGSIGTNPQHNQSTLLDHTPFFTHFAIHSIHVKN
jgi:hypothetical protein